MPDLIIVPENHIRIAAIIEYDGTRYAGLQVQENGLTIQEKIEHMAREFQVQDCQFRASGRTDSGVHARGQVITITLSRSILGKPLEKALNWHLPEDIRVRKAVHCRSDFDPRREARLRTYRYLLCSYQPRPPLMKNRMGHFKLRLDPDKLHEAAEILKGKHDFSAWRSTMCQSKRTVLDIREFRVERWSDMAPHEMDNMAFEVTISCRSFLHRMVRFLIGGIARVGTGRLSPDELKQHLDDEILPPGVAPAPACGLSLESVWYPPESNPFNPENTPQ